MECVTAETSLVRAAEIQGRGRGLVATHPIQAGQILLQETPLLNYPQSTPLEIPNTPTSVFCAHCFTLLPPSSIPLPCPSCTHYPPLLFCSSQCQARAQNTSHTPWVCKSLNMLKSSSLDLDTQTMAHFLIAAYNLAIVSPEKFQLLMPLQGNEGSVGSHTQLLHSFMASAMSSFWPGQRQVAGFSAELSGSLLAKDKQNAFGLMAPVRQHGERQVRAYAIYAQASFFNHDCLPNACRFEYLDKPGEHNTDIIIRALHDIQEGSEICLSYFPINWPYADRQKRLLEDYGFSCKCDRCRIEETWSDEESMDEENAVSENEMEDDEMELQEVDKNGETNVEGEGDFPHAFFFVKYLCPVENCGGTMAPLPPVSGGPSTVMECNMCSHLRTDDDFNQDLKDHGMAD